jgi:hypothetical protein
MIHSSGIRLRPGHLVAAAWGAIGIVVLTTLFLPARSIGDTLGLRRFLTPPLDGRWGTGQRFRMDARDLSGIEIRASAVGPIGGRFRLTLHDREYPNERSTEVSAADLVREDRYVFSFDPIHDSRGHEFQLDISPVPADPGRGVALWATKGDRLDRGGGLLINAKPRWASLAFQTHTGAVSMFRALLRGGDADRPPQWLALAGLLGSWIALGFVLKSITASAAA